MNEAQLIPPQGSRAGYQYAALTQNVRKTFTADRTFLVREIRIAAQTAITTETIEINLEGQSLFGGQAVPIKMLPVAVSDPGQTTGANGCIVFRPDVPFIWSQAFPIEIKCSAAAPLVLIMADAVVQPSR